MIDSILLLSSRPLGGFEAVNDLQEISLVISRFLSDHEAPVLLLDGLEYLISRFGFNVIFRFIQEKRFDFLESEAVLLLPVDLSTLSDGEIALINSEIKTI